MMTDREGGRVTRGRTYKPAIAGRCEGLERAGRTLPWSLHREAGPGDTWISDVWPPACERAHFCWSEPPTCGTLIQQRQEAKITGRTDISVTVTWILILCSNKRYQMSVFALGSRACRLSLVKTLIWGSLTVNFTRQLDGPTGCPDFRSNILGVSVRSFK